MPILVKNRKMFLYNHGMVFFPLINGIHSSDNMDIY